MTVIKFHLGYEQVPSPGPPHQSIRKKEKHLLNVTRRALNITSLMFWEHQSNGERSFVKEAFCIKILLVSIFQADLLTRQSLNDMLGSLDTWLR